MQAQQLRYILQLLSSNKLPDDYTELISQLGIDNCLYLIKTNGDFVKLYFKIRKQTIFTSTAHINTAILTLIAADPITIIKTHHHNIPINIPKTHSLAPYFEYGEI